jgi:hypothetical protein
VSIKYELPLPGRYVSAGAKLRCYECDAYSEKTNPTSRRRGDPIFKHISGLGININWVVGPDGARNQNRLCWRGPAAGHGMYYGACQWFCVGQP